MEVRSTSTFRWFIRSVQVRTTGKNKNRKPFWMRASYRILALIRPLRATATIPMTVTILSRS